MKKQKIDWRIIVVGLICLTALDIVALFNGIDGKLMMIVIGIIGLTIGVVLPNPMKS